MSAISWANVDGFKKFQIMVVCLDLMMENNEKNINICLFSMILKSLQATIYGWIETFFCLVANVGLTDLSRIFFGDSQG